MWANPWSLPLFWCEFRDWVFLVSVYCRLICCCVLGICLLVIAWMDSSITCQARRKILLTQSFLYANSALKILYHWHLLQCAAIVSRNVLIACCRGVGEAKRCSDWWDSAAERSSGETERWAECRSSVRVTTAGDRVECTQWRYIAPMWVALVILHVATARSPKNWTHDL